MTDELLADPADLAALADTKIDPVHASDLLVKVTGSRPALRIDLTDAGVVFAASVDGSEVLGTSADDATQKIAAFKSSAITLAKQAAAK